MSSNLYDIIVIGSGLGGLLSAFIMAKEGEKVCLLEKNKIPGGCLQSFVKNGRIYDTGVHYFGGLDEGKVLYRYWKYFGMTGLKNLEKMNPDGFDMISIKGKDYPLASGKDNFVERLLPFFPSELDTLNKYIESLDEITDRIPLYNLHESVNHSYNSNKSRNAHEFFSSFTDKENLLPDILSGNNFLYGGSKQSVPLYAAAVINHSFMSGAWRITGGTQQITEYLINKIKSFGGDVQTEMEVTEIAKQRENFNIIISSGVTLQSKIVISDLHPANTFKLVKDNPIRKIYTDRINSLRNTQGALTLFIGLKPKVFPHLDHNIHYYKEDVVWEKGNKPTPEFFMLYTIASPLDKNYAHGIVIMTRSSYNEYHQWDSSYTGSRGEFYNDFKQKKGEQLLDLVEEKFPFIRQHIENITISTPLTWRDYTGTPGGAMYGIERNCLDPDASWIPARTKIPGLFFTGQNTNMHGVLGVTIGAVQTCGEIAGLNYLLKKIRNV